MTRRRWLLLLSVALAVGLVSPAAPSPVRAVEGLVLDVTRAGDPPGAVCPSADSCTLRQALEAALAVPGEDPVVVRFSPAAFPPAEPVLVQPVTPFFAVGRPGVTIDGSGAGVVIDGGLLPGLASGLILAGPDSGVSDLRIQGFGGSCLTLAGERSVARRVEAGDCGTGVSLAAPGAKLVQGAIGFAADGSTPAPVDFGVYVGAADVVVGSSDGTTGDGNTIGNALAAIYVGGGDTPGFTGTVVGGNTVGRSPAGAPAPVEVGVQVVQPARGTLVIGNTVANTRLRGIGVAADNAGVSSAGNTFRANHFTALRGPAIDLDASGLGAPEDGDGGGANGGIDPPAITRATESRVTGTACAGCDVELHVAEHPGGDDPDTGASPVPGIATADGTGSFVFEDPAVDAGSWVTAIATDSDGNTSEFGPSVRVGAGVIQCANEALPAGWSFTGFFGPAPLAISAGLPGNLGAVRAIYHLEPDGTYTRWLRDTTAGRTLTVLEPGAAYWFLADAPVTLAGGFSLTSPVPVAVHEGLNDIVYLGGGAPIPDALASIAAVTTDVYRYNNDGTRAAWQQYGPPDLPAWARDFATAEACAAYRIAATGAGTLMPLQP